jgi:hypothetical protein
VVSSHGCNTCWILEVVLSTRRVAKGPGRRPQSAKREQFTRLLGKGWTVAAARREVGVSRTTGNRWKNGYNLYRRGELVGFVAALDPGDGASHLTVVLVCRGTGRDCRPASGRGLDPHDRGSAGTVPVDDQP